MQLYRIHTSVTIYHGRSAEREKAHNHSIEIDMYVEKATDDFQQFQEIELRTGAYFKQYENQFLNVMPEFHGDTSLENMGEVFFAGLTAALSGSKLTLRRLEVGETPLRTYIIGVEDGDETEAEEWKNEETKFALSNIGGF